MIASVSVGTTEVQVLPPPSGMPYKFVAIANNGPSLVYLKVTPDADPVTAENGIPLPAGGAIVCDQDQQKELFDGGAYAVTQSGSATVAVQAF